MSGFGFQPPAKPVTSQDVGASLMQQNQPPQPPQMGQSPGRGIAPEVGMRMAGANITGGPDQFSNEQGMEGMNPSAINAAVGEALTRQGNGHMPPTREFKDMGRFQHELRTLGMSDFEAQLMARMGGV